MLNQPTVNITCRLNPHLVRTVHFVIAIDDSNRITGRFNGCNEDWHNCNECIACEAEASTLLSEKIRKLSR